MNTDALKEIDNKIPTKEEVEAMCARVESMYQRKANHLAQAEDIDRKIKKITRKLAKAKVIISISDRMSDTPTVSLGRA